MALWGNRDSKSATGTIAIADTGVVTGSSTLFTTEADIGNYIRAGGADYQIVTITSNTVCKVESGINGGAIAVVSGGTSYTLSEKPASVAASESAGSPSGKHGNSNKVFGVDIYESFDSAGRVVEVGVATGGASYLEVPTVTLTGGGGSSAAATATISGGAVTAIAMTNVGSSYETVPTVVVDLPRRTIPTSGVTIATEQIAYATHGLGSASSVKYFTGGGAAITGLVDDTEYFVSALGLAAGTFRLAASAAAAPGRANLTAPVATSGTGGQFTCGNSTLAVGDRVVVSGTNAGSGTITDYTTGTIYTVSAVTGTSPSVTGFTLTTEAGVAIVTTAGTLTGLSFKPYTIVLISGTGNNAQYFEIQAAANRATAVANVGGGNETGESPTGIAHAGWVRRTTGTGGRAGRVQYETLVAMGSITGDQADDLQFQDD
jgi:hypothetical protein